MDVVGELIVRPRLDRSPTSRANARSSSRRSAPTSTTRPSTARSCSRPRCSATARSAARSAARRRTSGASPTAAIRDFWRSATGRPTPSSPWSATSATTRRPVSPATAFGTGNGVVPGFAPAPTLPAGPRVRPASAHEPGAALPGRPGAPPRPSRQLDAGRAQRGPRRRDEQPALPVRARGARAGLRRLVRARRLRRRRRPRDLGWRRPRRACRPRSRRSSSSWPGCATSRSPPPSWTKAKRYLAGGLELRMDDTRHVASWIGGQEALHDRVLTLDEALAAVEAVDAAAIQRLAGAALPRRSSCGSRPSPRRATCAASRRGCACRGDRGHAVAGPDRRRRSRDGHGHPR